MSSPNGKKLKIEHWHWISLFLIIFDYFAIAGSYFLALLSVFFLQAHSQAISSSLVQ